MASFKRFSLVLMSSTALLALSGCDGADGVASPGAGTVVINPPAPTPSPSPSPSPTPTSSPITAAQFAAVTAVNGISVTAEEQLAIVNAGANNNVNGTNATLNGVLPTGAASLATATDPSTINSFFTSTNYVGALNGPTDTAFQGWTCNSTTAQFGGSGASCTSVPAIGSGGSTATCPTGTIDDGVVATFHACRLPAVITGTLTLPKIAGVFYRLRGQTEVGTDVGTTGADSGAVLNIAAGVVIAADSTEVTNDMLLVNRGAKINAVGTVSEPIIFTSQQNLIANGVSDATQGQWGGVILLGRAPTAVCAAGTGPNNAAGSSTTCQLAIEGVTGRFYGGPDRCRQQRHDEVRADPIQWYRNQRRQRAAGPDPRRHRLGHRARPHPEP